MEDLLPVAFWAVLGASITLYVLLDGFDLGVGILYLFEHDKSDRDVMMLSVAPVWDGNETWLVAGAVVLLAGFPAAYALMMPQFYLPLFIMLMALVFRGVAFEFRFKANRARFIWDMAFAGGSLLAAFCQGLVLGGFIQGATDGGGFRWLSPFGVYCGLAVAAGYTLLGATWLVLKTEGELHERMRRTARVLVFVVVGSIGLISLWTPFVSANVYQRWFSMPNLLFLAPVPLAVLGVTWWLFRSLARDGNDHHPFIAAVLLFALGLLGFGVSLWPWIVPFRVTLWDAAAPAVSLEFALVGVALFLPAVLAYTAWSYWVFRGKVRADAAGYH